MSHTIHFQRPETPYGTARIRVPSAADTAKQIRRLEDLGYAILDVSPPLQDALLSSADLLAKR